MRDYGWYNAARANLNISLKSMSWAQYLAALHTMDQAWWTNMRKAVLDESKTSWERTIRHGRAVVMKASWETLSTLEADVLIGSSYRDEAYEFLGNNTAAGAANGMLRGPAGREQRMKIHKELRSLLDVPVATFPLSAANVLRRLLSMDRIGIAVATRLIALARPDCGVSLNGASCNRLALESGLGKTTLKKPENYQRLLAWVGKQAWHTAPRPSNDRDARIWEIRAALFDCLVYEPGTPDKESHAGPGATSRPYRTARVEEPEPVDVHAAIMQVFALATRHLAGFLQARLPDIGGNRWWANCVEKCLSQNQLQALSARGHHAIEHLDFAALVRVVDRNWSILSARYGLPRDASPYFKEAANIRNRWMHKGSSEFAIDDAYRDLDTMRRILAATGAPAEVIAGIQTVLKGLR